MDADIFVNYVYELIAYLARLWAAFEPLLLLQYPYCRELAFASNAVTGALNVYAANAGNQLYWIHELVLVVINTFGGGLVTPILLGRPALVFNNDVIIFSCIVAWFTIFYLKGHIWWNYQPFKTVRLFFVGLFRAFSQTNMVQLSHSILNATPYYPVPVFGPIICGTLLGSMGMFLPFDKGLAPIKNNCPWNLQAAFYTSVFYHFMVNDTHGFIGEGFRNVFGHLTRPQVIVVISIVHVLHVLLQAFLSPEVNFFTPLHKLLYIFFPVNGPKVVQKPPVNGVSAPVGWDKEARKRLKILIDIARVLFVGSVIVAHVYFHISPVKLVTESLPWELTHTASPVTPPYPVEATGGPFKALLSIFNPSAAKQSRGEDPAVSAFINQKTGVPQKLVLTEKDFEFFASQALPLNGSIGACQFLTNFRRCSPYLARLEQVNCSDEQPVRSSFSNHPFCNPQDKQYSPSREIYRLAVYNTSVYRYLVREKQGVLQGLLPLYRIPLATVDSFDSKEVEVLHRNHSLLHLSPSLHISVEGWLVLLKPIRVVGHSVTILYNHVGNIQPVDHRSQPGVCGVIPKTITKEGSLAANVVVESVQFAKDGSLVATCRNHGENKKEEL